jgi:RHS repeat-associated protein
MEDRNQSVYDGAGCGGGSRSLSFGGASGYRYDGLGERVLERIVKHAGVSGWPTWACATTGNGFAGNGQFVCGAVGAEGREPNAGDGHPWGESYGYDNWGNMMTKTVTVGSGTNFDVTPSTQNRLSNLSYDTAGEVTGDQFGNAYAYDAEGRLRSAGIGSYLYDGDGQRVKKTVSGATTLYWYGAGGLLDESDAAASTMAKQVKIAGLTVWSEAVGSTGRFLFHDHLGSVRLIGDAAGNLKDDYDYRPFGAVVADYGAAPTNNHYTFTGYESDQSESGTDYADFRNLSTSMSRFNRPDPYDGSYDPNNPQSLNRYSYALNNPLSYVDPLGLVICDWGPSDFGGEDYDNDPDCGVDGDGGSVVEVDASVTVYADGSGSDIVTLEGPVLYQLIDLSQWSAPNSGMPKPPMTPQQQHAQQRTQLNLKCAAATASSGALFVTAGLNEVGAAFTGEVTPVAAIFHGIAIGEGIAGGAFGIYAGFVCFAAAEF